MKHVPLILALAGLAAGCSSLPDEAARSKARPDVDVKIAQALEDSARANRMIAEIETAAAAPSAPAPAQTLPEGVSLPPELETLFTVEWRGPLNALLSEMARKIDYEFVLTGAQPSNPVMIDMHRTDAPVWRIVRDAGVLATSQATVVLDPSDKRIEVRYADRSAARHVPAGASK